MVEVAHAHGMRPLTDLLPHAEALQRILASAQPVAEAEEVPLGRCLGRALAEPVIAAHDVPGFDRAAMDGFAMRARDTAAASASAPARLRPIAVVHAGGPSTVPVGPGQCAQVATGAPLPPGSDAVVMVERTRLHEGDVLVERPVRERENVSPRGADMRAGDAPLPAGALMNPARLAVAAALGLETVRVWRRPRVAVFSTGSELRPPGKPLAPGEVHDSNGPALAALFELHGAEVVRRAVLPDDVAVIRTALRQESAHDLVVASGASSAGERDVLRDAVAAEGRIEFHGVRVKPGKPLLFGRVGHALVVGLPGYPTSCLSDAYLFALPALARMAHRPTPPPQRIRARLSQRVASVPDRLWFLPVKLENGLAVPTYKESGATTSLADAVGYVEVPPDVPFLEGGDAVDVILF